MGLFEIKRTFYYRIFSNISLGVYSSTNSTALKPFTNRLNARVIEAIKGLVYMSQKFKHHNILRIVLS